MHELSIAQYMVEQAAHAARSEGAARILSVRARVGALSGVVKESLVFSWEIAAQGTLCEGSRLEIEDVPVTARCPKDGQPKALGFPPRFRCPDCGEPTPELLTGKELELASVEWTP